MELGGFGGGFGGGGRNETATGGAGQIGGAGRGASGAATLFGDKTFGNDSPVLAIVGVIAGVAIMGLLVFAIIRSN